MYSQKSFKEKPQFKMINFQRDKQHTDSRFTQSFHGKWSESDIPLFKWMIS